MPEQIVVDLHNGFVSWAQDGATVEEVGEGLLQFRCWIDSFDDELLEIDGSPNHWGDWNATNLAGVMRHFGKPLSEERIFRGRLQQANAKDGQTAECCMDTATISSRPPSGITGRICWKSPPKMTGSPPKGSSTPGKVDRRSCKVRSTASKTCRWVMGVSSHEEVCRAEEFGRLAVPCDPAGGSVVDGDGNLEALVGSTFTGQKLGGDARRRHKKHNLAFGPQPVA